MGQRRQRQRTVSRPSAPTLPFCHPHRANPLAWGLLPWNQRGMIGVSPWSQRPGKTWLPSSWWWGIAYPTIGRQEGRQSPTFQKISPCQGGDPRRHPQSSYCVVVLPFAVKAI
jgi:hypothetical protein